MVIFLQSVSRFMNGRLRRIPGGKRQREKVEPEARRQTKGDDSQRDVATKGRVKGTDRMPVSRFVFQ